MRRLSIVWISLFLASQLIAEEVETSTASDQATPVQTVEKVDVADAKSRLLGLGARVDASFMGGGQVQQGFAIPSLRLTAFGDVGQHLDYRLSFGQTREHSTVLLPQILPTEAYIDLATDIDFRLSHLHWRLGMFNPTLNPWWTPDLGSLSLPDYHETHKALLLNNDVGTEICFQPIHDRLEFSLGAFNGNGIFSQNSNNTRAFVAFLRGGIPVGTSRIQMGTGAYYLVQSTVGSVNYKMQWVLNFFFNVTTPLADVGVDALAGNFEDNTRQVSPMGGAVFGTFEVLERWKLFFRAEGLQQSPISGGTLTNVQMGPLWELDALRVFLFYQSLDTGLEDREVSGQVRVRLAI